jgi:hypothetical protein
MQSVTEFPGSDEWFSHREGTKSLGLIVEEATESAQSRKFAWNFRIKAD